MRVRKENTRNDKKSQFNGVDGFLYTSLGILTLLVFFSIFVLSNSAPKASADGNKVASTNATVEVSSVCSMTSTVTSEHSAKIFNGHYNTDGIGSTTLKTFCNDAGGYAIYAIGYTGGDAGIAANTNTRLIDSRLDHSNDILSTATGDNNTPILDGTISNWAMKITPVAGTHEPNVLSAFSSWAAIPANYARVAEYNTTTDSSDINNPEGSSIITTYAASIAPDQPAGTYSGKVKYILVHPQSSSDANYTNKTLQNVASGYDSVSGDGWGGTLLVNETTTAKDERDDKVYTVSRLCMRTDGIACDTNSADETHSKLWITQNLETDLTDSTITFDSTNTNIHENLGLTAGYSTDPNTGVITWRPSVTEATITNFAAGNQPDSVTGWTNDNAHPYQAVAGDSQNHYMYQGTAYPTSTNTTCEEAHSLEECRPYKVGNYYNYSAAIAMNNSSSVSAWHEVAPNSICPAGWRLPKGLVNSNGDTGASSVANTASEYNQLLYANGYVDSLDYTQDGNANGNGPVLSFVNDGRVKFESGPFYFARSGYVNGTTFYYWGSNGHYWSSTAVSGSYAYHLVYNGSTAYPANRYNRNYGRSVRCLAETFSINEITTMQDFDALTDSQLAKVKGSMQPGKTYTLTDSRDGNEYKIAKLADGKIWMVDNLRLDPTDSTTAANMTATTTNAPDNAIQNYLNGSAATPQSGWSTTAVSNSAVNAWTNYYDVPQINTAWNKDNVSNDKDTVVGNHYGLGSGKRGVYYNFCAATAGTYCWAGGAGKDLPDTIVDAPYDICPAGWHMPTGGVRKNDTEQTDTGEIGDYQTLCNILNGSNCTNGMSMTATNQNSLQYKLGLPLSGDLASDTQNYYGSYGFWWSSTYYNGSAMYNLHVGSGGVWPMLDYGRRAGLAMRCVAGS